MIKIKRLAECSLIDATTAWNKGFEGYYFNMETTVEQFTKRLVLEGLSPLLSVVAFEGERPIGLVLSGIREIDGQKVAWNGGTGVDPDFRGKGIGKLLLEHVLSIYQQEGVKLSTLEAISKNKSAIKLYEKMGYRVVDELVHLQFTGPLQTEITSNAENYTLKRGIPIDVAALDFYKGMTTWQTQWNNARDGEAMIALNKAQQAVGYAIYKRMFNEEGKLTAILLFQCETNPSHEDKEEVIRYLLSNVFSPTDLPIKRTAVNLSKSNKIVYNILGKTGFSISAEQVWMTTKV